MLIVPVWLHGILGYICFIQNSRTESSYLEDVSHLAKLGRVQIPEHQAYYSELPLPVEPQIPSQEVGPNNPPWGSGVAIALWIFSVAMILVVPSLFLGIYFVASGSDLSDPTMLAKAMANDPMAIWISVIAILPAHIITLIVCWLIVTKGRTYPFFKTLGWNAGGMRWYHHILILIGFFALSVVVGNFVEAPDHELLRMINSSRLTLFTMAALAVLTAPLIEELVYRGIVYSALQRAISPWIAVAITTFLFTLVHVPQYFGSPATIGLLALLSLTLTVIRMKTDNLLPCVIFHTVFNAVQSIVMVAGAYATNPPSTESTPAAFVVRLCGF